MRRPMDIRETLYRLLTALRATTCDDQRCIVYLQHYTQRHAKTDGYQRDVVSFTYSITRNDMRRPTDIRETLHRLLTALHATTCDDQRISERRCIVYLQHYTQRHAKTDGYQRDVVSFTYSITRNDMRRPTDIRETLHRLLTALHATTCGDQRISERRCIVYLQHYSQRHAETSGYQRDVVSFTYSITRNDMRRPMDIRETLYRLHTALHATTCDDQRISETRCIVYLQHYTQRHAKTNGYQRDVVSFTYGITRNDMRRPTDIRETLYLLLIALHATTCEERWISERRCIVYLQHYAQRHATTNGYQRDVASFTYSITRNDMRRPMDIRETLYRLLTALRAMTCDDQRISERRCIVYLLHYTQRHAATNGYQRDVVSFTYSITRNDMRRPMDIRETLYRLLTALRATTCDDQRISERRCIVYLLHYTQRHAATNGYQRDVVSFTYSITRNDMRRPVDIRETLYRLLTALHATTCDDQRISEKSCIVYLQHYTQRHATTNGYQRDVVSFTYSITRNDMRRPKDIRQTLYRLLTALHTTTCDDQRISERRCIFYLQHYAQRHATTNGYQRDVVSFTYSITRNDMRRPMDIRETLYRLLAALRATTCEDQRISERRCIVYLQHYTQRHAKTDGYQRDVVSFTYSITRNDMRRPTDIREMLHRLLTALHVTTCDNQRISERRCIVYLQHYAQRHAETSGYQRDVVSFTYSITRNDMRRPTDIREKLYRLLTALRATTCDDQRISERRCIVYLLHYTQRHAATNGYQRDVVSFTYSITRNDMRRPVDIRETLYRLLTALRATTCEDQWISERRCIVYLQHYTQRHATTNGYQRDVVSFTYSITRNDMRRPMDIRETLYRLLTALHATTCDDQRISERRCIVYLQHYTQRHAKTDGYQRDVVSFTYSITRNDMRRPTDIRETLYRLLTALHATTCGDQRISERRCIVYLQHYSQRHAETSGYQRDVVSFTYSITRNDMRRPTDIRETLYRLFTALHATTCDDQRISERRCIVYLQHYTQRHAKTEGYQTDVVSFTYSITRNDMRRPTDIRETLYLLLTALRATTCDDQRISKRCCIFYLQHNTQRHAKTDGYQRDVVSFTCSITRNDMRRPTDIRETLHRLLTALHATTCEDRWISERRCIVYLQHYAQRHATTNGYQRDVASFTYCITRNDMRQPTDIRETLYRLFTALRATTCGDQWISERRCIVYLQHYSQRHATTNGYQRKVVSFIYSITRNDMRRPKDIRQTLYRLLTALHATTCDDQRISERRCIVYLQHYTQRHATTNGYQRDVVSFTYSIKRNDMRRPMDIRETLYRLLAALRATTCDDQRISERRCIVYLLHYTQRHAATNGYQRDVVSFTYSITRNDMRRPTDIRETLYRLLTALHATTCEDRWISERRCIVYLQHYAQRHATTNGYQRDVVSFIYSITRNDMRRPMDIRETLYRLLTALRATTCDDQRISERRCIVRVML